MKILKSVAVLCLIGMPTTASAAKTPDDLLLLSRLRRPASDFMPYKYVGSPTIVEGPVAPGAVIIRQRVAFVRTGVLRTKVSLTQPDRSRVLKAGTPMVMISYDYGAVWCVLPGLRKEAVCFVSISGKNYWTEFRGPFDDWLSYIGASKRYKFPCSAVIVDERPLPYPAEFETYVTLAANKPHITIVQKSLGKGNLSFTGTNARLGLEHRRTYGDGVYTQLSGAGGVGVELSRANDGSVWAQRVGPPEK